MLLQSVAIAITKWGRYFKVVQLLQHRAVHFCDTKKNGDSYLLIRPIRFESGVV